MLILLTFRHGSTQNTNLREFDVLLGQSDTLILLSKQSLKSCNLAHSERVILREQVDSLNKVINSCVDHVKNYEVYVGTLQREIQLQNEKTMIYKTESDRQRKRVRLWQIVSGVVSGVLVWQMAH